MGAIDDCMNSCMGCSQLLSITDVSNMSYMMSRHVHSDEH